MEANEYRNAALKLPYPLACTASDRPVAAKIQVNLGTEILNFAANPAAVGAAQVHRCHPTRRSRLTNKNTPSAPPQEAKQPPTKTKGASSIPVLVLSAVAA